MARATHLVDAAATVAAQEGGVAQSVHFEENPTAAARIIQDQLQLLHKNEFQECNENEAITAAVHDANARLFKIADILQTAAKALHQVAESKAHAEEEALMWKRKFEQLSTSPIQRTERIVEETVAGRRIVKQENVVTYQLPNNEAASSLDDAPAATKGLSSHRTIRSKSIPGTSLNYDYRTVVPQVHPPEYGKVSFRLEWRSERDHGKQHHQDVVTFDSGNIGSGAGNNKQIVLEWDSPPQSVCIFMKPSCKFVQDVCVAMIKWLKEAKKMVIFVEPRVRKELLAEVPELTYLQTWQSGEEYLLHNKIDFLVTLGGDGTVLWAASLFKGPVPPVVSFGLGTVGFMTPFQSEHYKKHLTSIMKGPVYITLRQRLHCRVVRHDKSAADEVHIVLNEVAIDRGMSSFLTNLECYCDNMFITNVQGDGLILSTPSGSTAYSLSAGGSMVHPQVAAILFTPICPHSLSFRPLILPDHVTVRVQVPLTSRGDAWAAFDAREQVKLGRGDALVCHLSSWPVPTACTDESTSAFLDGVREELHWNMRKIQGERG